MPKLSPKHHNNSTTNLTDAERHPDETHHCLGSVEVVVVSSLSAARAVLLVLLAVLLLLLLFHRSRSTVGALCSRGSDSRFNSEPGTLLQGIMRRETLPGGFLRMNVQSLCLVSSMPRYPQALQELPMVCFLGLTCWRKDKRTAEELKEGNTQQYRTDSSTLPC